MSRLSALSHTCVCMTEMGNPVPMIRPGLFWPLAPSIPDHTLHRDISPQNMFTGHLSQPALESLGSQAQWSQQMTTGRGNSTLTGQQTFDKLTPELKNGLHEVQVGAPKACGPFCL